MCTSPQICGRDRFLLVQGCLTGQTWREDRNAKLALGVPCRPNLGLTHQCTVGTGEHHSGLKQTRIMTSATNEIGNMSMDRAVDARKFLLSFSLVALD